MCRSEARRETTSISRSAKSMSIAAPIGPAGARFATAGCGLDENSSPVRGCRLAGADHAGDLSDRGAALLDLLEPVIAQPRHPLANRHLLDLLGGSAFEYHGLDLARDQHHL